MPTAHLTHFYIYVYDDMETQFFQNVFILQFHKTALVRMTRLGDYFGQIIEKEKNCPNFWPFTMEKVLILTNIDRAACWAIFCEFGLMQTSN
jgi:hypothetical protein